MSPERLPPLPSSVQFNRMDTSELQVNIIGIAHSQTWAWRYCFEERRWWVCPDDGELLHMAPFYNAMTSDQTNTCYSWLHYQSKYTAVKSSCQHVLYLSRRPYCCCYVKTLYLLFWWYYIVCFGDVMIENILSIWVYISLSDAIWLTKNAFWPC